MELSKLTVLTAVLGRAERYNSCDCCGGNVYIGLDEDNMYCTRCTECGITLCTDIICTPGENAVDVCRHPFNTIVVKEMYMNAALERMGAQDGDFLVTRGSDGFILFIGTASDMLDFLKSDESYEKNFKIYQLNDRIFDPVGIFLQGH